MPAMKLYKFILHVGGDQKNTVPKQGISASELVLMRNMHGRDSVTDIEEDGMKGVTAQEAYSELAHKFHRSKSALDAIGNLFGAIDNPRMVWEVTDTKPIPEEDVNLPPRRGQDGKVQEGANGSAEDPAPEMSRPELLARLKELNVPFKGNISTVAAKALLVDALAELSGDKDEPKTEE